MKIKQPQFDTMMAAVKAAVEHAGGPQAVRKAYATKTVGRMLWDLWNTASDSLKYDDSHPFFVSGEWSRVCPQQPAFDVYANGANDAHIETALRKIGKALGLT